MKNAVSDCRNCKTFQTGIFSSLSENALEQIAKTKVTNHYRKGQIIFHEGRRAFGFYCVTTGKVKLEKIMSCNDKGFIYKIANSTDLIGYQAFFTGEKYTETAQALEDTTLCFFDKELFYKFINEEKNFAFKVFSLMTENFNYLLDKSRDLACKSVRERFIGLMRELEKFYGVKQNDGTIKIDIDLTRAELSSMLGATTETTVRVLGILISEDIIETRKKRLYIKDLKILENNEDGGFLFN